MTHPSPAALWGAIVADELYRAGLRRVVIAPGSRSTPLTLAFTAHGGYQLWQHVDERSAAFFALGLSKADGAPTALVCTSGTAAAEFFPALIEASHTNVPLLALTADRPPELRESGANQTMNQRQLYGGFVRWEYELPLPEAAPSPRLLHALRTALDRALAATRGWGGAPGPVHLNLPFRKPLQPASPADWEALRREARRSGRPDGAPWTQLSLPRGGPAAADLEALADQLTRARRPLVVAGPLDEALAPDIAALAARLGAPLLADPLSNLRFGDHPARRQVIGGYDWGLEGLPLPDLVLRFGAPPTSKALNDWLEALPPDLPQIGLHPPGRWADGGFNLQRTYPLGGAQIWRELAAALPARPGGDWLAAWQAREARVQQALEQLPPASEGGLVRALFAALPSESWVFLANSLPVRHVDAFAAPRPARLHLRGNRGLSGIDGVLSTAAGMAAASGGPALLLTGDLSLLHDQNGLLWLRQPGVKLDVVLLNNHGGGIFHRLPIADFEPPFRQWFLTPQPVDFAASAAVFGVTYQRVQPEAAAAALDAARQSPESHLLEIVTDSAASEQLRRSLSAKLSSGSV